MFVFYVDLATGQFASARTIYCADIERRRLFQARHLHHILRPHTHVLWTPSQHSSRRLHHPPFVHPQVSRSPSVSSSDEQHERTVSRRVEGGNDEYGRSDLYHLSRRHGVSWTARSSRCWRGWSRSGAATAAAAYAADEWSERHAEEIALWSCFPLSLSAELARTSTVVSYLVSALLYPNTTAETESI